MTREEAINILETNAINATGTLAALPSTAAEVSSLNRQIEALDMAIAALEKQIPYETKLEKSSGHYWGRCKCTDKIEYNLDKSKYCGNCGQFLKGRDEE